MSNINPQNIDGAYPIAGQDNNSQGFRDNFTNTVNNFTFAAAELTDLQTYAILAAPLGSVGQTSTENNNTINYTIISEPQFKKAVETTKFIGNTSAGTNFEVDWSQGHFQTVGVTSTATMSFLSTWPTTNLHTKLRLQITSYGTTAITLPGEVSQNVNNIQGVSSNVLTVGSGVYQFEFTTEDQGATIAIRDLWRNYDAPIDFTNLVVSGYSSIAGNLIAGLSRFAAINSTPIGNATPSTGAFSNLSATGTTTFGNLSYSGTQVETGYQQIKPTANVANVSISPTVNRVLIHPTSVLAAFGGSFGANLTLPNTQVDGTIISISSNVTIASLSVITPWVGTSVSPVGNTTSVVPGTVSRFMFINADKVWYKIA
jgi:hypothetical protein